jgi:hypothetical protein
MELGTVLKRGRQLFMVVHIQINHDRGPEFADNRDWFRAINLTDEHGQPTQEFHLYQHYMTDLGAEFDQ